MELEFAYDYSQVDLYDAGREWSENSNEFLNALDDAQARGLSVGLDAGFVDILMPRQHNFHCPLSVEPSDSAPPVDGDWDHIIEFPLPLPTGKLVLEGSGGCEKTEVDLSPGVFRARWSGPNFAKAAAWNYPDDPDDQSRPPDQYRLQYWPDPAQNPPQEIKRWADFKSHLGCAATAPTRIGSHQPTRRPCCARPRQCRGPRLRPDVLAGAAEPLHEQIAAALRRAITDGEARPGDRLPPASDLAAVLGVNANTVLRAVRTLRDEGLLEFRHRHHRCARADATRGQSP